MTRSHELACDGAQGGDTQTPLSAVSALTSRATFVSGFTGAAVRCLSLSEIWTSSHTSRDQLMNGPGIISVAQNLAADMSLYKKIPAVSVYILLKHCSAYTILSWHVLTGITNKQESILHRIYQNGGSIL